VTTINATVRDHSGKDVTTHFKTMLYRAPHWRGIKQLNDRQAAYLRPIDACEENEGIFVDSSCVHKNKVLGSLQAYTYNCLRYVPDPRRPRYGRGVVVPYAGSCRDDEICVSGSGENPMRRNSTVEMAYCVQTEAYIRLANSNGRIEFDESSENARLDLALSEEDQKTPLEADQVSATSGVSSLSGAKGSTQSKSCMDCLDLDTELFHNADFMKTEVRLLVSGVAAGILWLTIWSG
jgi:hypothetical protein